MTLPRSRNTKSSGLASLACIGCRKQHLKCDSKRPTCSRCFQSGQECIYEPSRRGGRRKPLVRLQSEPQRPATTSTSSMDAVPGSSHPSIAPSSQGTSGRNSISLNNFGPESLIVKEGASAAEPQSRSIVPAATPGLNAPSLRSQSFSGPNNESYLSYFSNVTSENLLWPTTLAHGGLREPAQPQAQSTNRCATESDRFLRLYYENFHIAHPILVPGSMYAARAYPDFLQLVVKFAGSHYVQQSPREDLKQRVASELTTNPTRSACMVQAWLIYTIVLFSRGDLDEAHSAFASCAEIALEIGMHRDNFVTSSCPETSIEAESLRRTWWELFVTDILVAIPLRTISFRCSAVSPEVSLPCEETLYTEESQIPQPRKILDFKRRVLAAEDVVFSSFSYRIEAATILGRVLVLNRLKDYHRDHLQAIENALVSWANHLPTEKLDIVDSYGNMDEMMFQAHAIIAYASMLLHLPRSRFYPLMSNAQDPFLPFTQLHSSSASTRLVHSIKATDASRRISDYVSLCPNIQRHTPFVIPALVICGLIQLATCSAHSEECFDHHFNRITLILGCLKNMKRTWHLADPAYQRVRSCAATLISDSMDKWTAEPFSKSISLALSTPTDTGRPSTISPDADAQGSQISPMPQLDSSLADPACYNYSLFSSLPEFDSTWLSHV